MAVMEMTPVKGELNKVTPFAFEAATAASDGFVFKLPRMTDEYVVVLVQNTGSGAGTFTVKKPEKGSYFAAGGDETFNLAAGEFGIFRFESAKWANNDGTIHCVPGATTVKAVVLY